MQSDKARVLARVRAALARLPERQPMPPYADDVTHRDAPPAEGERATRFIEQVTRAGGRAFTDLGTLVDWLCSGRTTHGYCDPALLGELGPALSGRVSVDSKFVRERIDAYRFAITRAVGAIAETGSIILDDRTTCSRLAALAPWVHIAVVRRDAIHVRLSDALRALGDDPYVVFCTGPSKTADVEGILIEGVHGPGEQVALVLP